MLSSRCACCTKISWRNTSSSGLGQKMGGWRWNFWGNPGNPPISLNPQPWNAMNSNGGNLLYSKPPKTVVFLSRSKWRSFLILS
jgi:hypothetical protein